MSSTCSGTICVSACVHGQVVSGPETQPQDSYESATQGQHDQADSVLCILNRISRNIQYPVLTYVSNNLLNFRSRAQGYLMYCPAAIVRKRPLPVHLTPHCAPCTCRLVLSHCTTF